MMKRSTGDSGARSILIAHPSADLYGSDRVMLESITGLVSRGHRVVVTLPSAGALVREIEQRGAAVEFCASPVLRKSALRPVGFLQLVVETARSIPRSMSVIRRNGAEVVYVNTLTVPLWMLLGRLMRRPVVCHVHEAEASASLTVRRLLCLPLLLANRLIVNSAFSLKVISGAFPLLTRRAVVVYNAVSGPESPAPARDQLSGATRLLFVGRLSPRKGPDIAIAAVENLRARGLTAELDLIGAEFPGYEWFTQELRETVSAQGLTDHVHFHGFQDDVWPFLLRSDIAVVPSTIDEPFGNTAVEAVLAARPLIVSATSGLVEAVEGYSSVSQVPPGRPEAIADAVAAVVADWGGFRDRALDDSVQAAARHDARHYGRQIADIVEGLLWPSAIPRGEHAGQRMMSQEADQQEKARGGLADTDELKVVVALATYHRPDELDRTLREVLDQIEESALPIDVLVVDNDADASARGVVDALADRGVRHVVEPAPGIAAARNRAIAESSDRDVLIFIDDDEEPRAGWLIALLATYRSSGAAAVVGPVVSEFDGAVDPWIAAGGFFERRRLPTGTTVQAAATNNLLLDLRKIRALGLSFDERFGLSGGSDTLFTRTLTSAGQSIIWCDQAIVVDHVSQARATREWVTKRAMRYGNSWSRTSVALSASRMSAILARVEMSGRGVVRIVAGAGRLGIGVVSSSTRHEARGTRTMMKGIGYVRGAVGSTYVEYARPSVTSASAATQPR